MRNVLNQHVPHKETEWLAEYINSQHKMHLSVQNRPLLFHLIICRLSRCNQDSFLPGRPQDKLSDCVYTIRRQKTDPRSILFGQLLKPRELIAPKMAKLIRQTDTPRIRKGFTQTHNIKISVLSIFSKNIFQNQFPPYSPDLVLSYSQN